jgi:hypothetical protein
MERASRESRRWAKREIKARKRGTYGVDKPRVGRLAVLKLRAKRVRGAPRRVPSWFVATVVVLAIVGLTSTADLWWPQRPGGGSRSADASVDPRVVPPMYPTAAPATEASVSPSPTAKVSPFAGSPVEKWAEGSAGLVLPAAHRLEPFTQAQETDAFEKTRKFLRAAALKPSVVFGGRLGPVTKTINSNSGAFLLKRLRNATGKHNALSWVTRFDRRLVRSESHVIKVNGSMHARSHAGFLAVDYDYAFVYALADTRSDAAQLVSIRRIGTVLFEAPRGDFRRVDQPALSRGSYLDSASLCHEKDPKDFLPVAFEDATVDDSSSLPADATPEPTTAINPLDVRRPLPSMVGCYTDTSGL